MCLADTTARLTQNWRRKGVAHAPSVLFLFSIAAVSAIRLSYCVELPANTGDITRHLYVGLSVEAFGLEAAGQPLAAISPSLRRVAWSEIPYGYPVVPLVFFTVVSLIWPSIFFAKLVLTAIEGYNAWQLYRLTEQRWVGVLYWGLPASIWWVSHEAQFEPLQVVFVLAALRLLSRRPAEAFLLLALAIQVKLTAVLLLPLFLFQGRASSRVPSIRWLGAFLIGLLPSLIVQTQYPVVQHAFVATLNKEIVYNPYYWNVFARSYFDWNPYWLIVWDQISTYGMLLILLIAAAITGGWIQYSPAVLFLVTLKAAVRAQFWYLVLLPSFLAPIGNVRARASLFLLLPLVEPRSVIEMISGPFGYVVPSGYYVGMTAFTALSLPL